MVFVLLLDARGGGWHQKRRWKKADSTPGGHFTPGQHQRSHLRQDGPEKMKILIISPSFSIRKWHELREESGCYIWGQRRERDCGGGDCVRVETKTGDQKASTWSADSNSTRTNKGRRR